MGPDTGETRHEETAMHQSRSTDGLSGEEAPSSPRPSMGAHSGNGGRALWERLGLLAVSAVVAVAAGLVTRVRWGTEPTADLAALLLHVGVLAVGVGGMLGVVALPRGRRSGLGLALMATSMLVLFAEPAWHLGPLATTGFLAAFVPGLWLVAGPSDIGRRPAAHTSPEMPALPGNGPPAPTEPAA